MRTLLLSLSLLSFMTFNTYGSEQNSAQKLVDIAKKERIVIATAESCSGGMISSAITDIPGSSAIFEFGFITYANRAKEQLLGVKHDTIEKYGAVSQETAIEMANGALSLSNADIVVAVTGIAGPTGGSDDKPVGLVYIAIATKNQVVVTKNHFDGDRNAIRIATTKKAIELLIKEIENS